MQVLDVTRSRTIPLLFSNKLKNHRFENLLRHFILKYICTLHIHFIQIYLLTFINFRVKYICSVLKFTFTFKTFSYIHAYIFIVHSSVILINIKKKKNRQCVDASLYHSRI